MEASARRQSLLIATLGMLAILSPGLLLGYTAPARYELEVVRWLGLALIGFAVLRPWALAAGGEPRRRMQRWTGTTVAMGVMYVFTTNPLFLIVGFATIVGGVLDAAVERGTRAAHDMLTRLHEEGRTE